MPKATILIADNHPRFLETMVRILERAGYRVLCASSPSEARLILIRERLDAAVLDLRLENDEDKDDISGLVLAQECAPTLPKIILTHYPSYEQALAALVARPGSFPPAVRFVEKLPADGSGAQLMLQAVEDAIQIGRKGFGITVDEVTHGLNEDYEQARRDARMQTWIAGFISVMGVIVILIGVGVALFQPEIYPVGVIASLGGLITETVNILFMQRLDKAHARVDRFHKELYQIKLLKTLSAAADDLNSEAAREHTRADILRQAGLAWFRDEKWLLENNPQDKDSERAQ